MIKVIHRVNTVKKLNKINANYGVEIDLRSIDKEIILCHDPFKKGILFKHWIKYYKHRLIVLNVKEEGLEKKIITILRKNRINNYFFHDQTFSSMLKNMKRTKVSIRFSEYEKIANKKKLFKYIKWVWLDNFTHIPLDSKFYKYLSKNKINLCLVSPELVKKTRKAEINHLRKKINKLRYNFQAVCTKYPSLWNE